MAYTDDWESLMNGVFGPGGRFKAAPGTSAPKTGGSAALPDLNAALLEQQKRLDELLKQQNAQLKTQSDATAAALESSRQMLRDMEDEGLLARGTTDVKPEHLGSFEGLAAEVKQTVLGQDAFVDSVVRAMRRPFVLGTEAPPPATSSCSQAGQAQAGILHWKKLPAAWRPGAFCRATGSPRWIWPFTPIPEPRSSSCRTSTPPCTHPGRSLPLSTMRAVIPAF